MARKRASRWEDDDGDERDELDGEEGSNLYAHDDDDDDDIDYGAEYDVDDDEDDEVVEVTGRGRGRGRDREDDDEDEDEDDVEDAPGLDRELEFDEEPPRGAGRKTSSRSRSTPREPAKGAPKRRGRVASRSEESSPAGGRKRATKSPRGASDVRQGESSRGIAPRASSESREKKESKSPRAPRPARDDRDEAESREVRDEREERESREREIQERERRLAAEAADQAVLEPEELEAVAPEAVVPEVELPPDNQDAVEALREMGARVDMNEQGRVWRIFLYEQSRDPVAAQIHGFPMLKEIWLLGSKVTPHMVERLREAYPDVKVFA